MSSLSFTFQEISKWMSSNLLALNPSKTEFLVIGTSQQTSKLPNTELTLTPETSIPPTSSARNLGFIFDSHLTYHDQISALSKSCFFHIRDLRRIRPCLDYHTAANIAASLVHSKLDYCNSLYLNLPKNELNRLQQIQNTLARTVANAKHHDHITPILQSLHWLKIQERIHYKVISITYNILHTPEPQYLARLITLQPQRSTRSSKYITLYPPAITSRRTVLNRSFSYTAPRLWNALPNHLREPDIEQPAMNSLLKASFLSKLKTHLFTQSYPDTYTKPPSPPPPPWPSD
jgi:hypothetical protein